MTRRHRYDDLPGLAKLGMVAGLWAARAVLAFVAALCGTAVGAVIVDALRGVDSHPMTDPETAIFFLLILVASPAIWWWLGRRRLLATPRDEKTVDEIVRERIDAFLDLSWATAKLLAFLALTFAATIAWAVVIGLPLEALLRREVTSSDRFITCMMLGGGVSTWIGWRWAAGRRRLGRGARRRQEAGTATEGEPAAATEYEPAAANPSPVGSSDLAYLEALEADVDSWPGVTQIGADGSDGPTSTGPPRDKAQSATRD